MAALLGLLLACNDPDPPPALEVAFFSFSVDGAIVSFADASVPEPTAWQWDFAGLGTSSEQNPEFDFGGEGQYPVTLTVEFPSGNEESVERTVEITHAPDDPGEAISVTVTPTTALVAPGDTQEFQATVHGTSNTDVTWSTTGGQLTASGNAATYTAPAAPGTYSITATSQADTGQRATAIVSVTADDGQPDPVDSLTGTWSGSLTYIDHPGLKAYLSFEVVQDGDAITGTATSTEYDADSPGAYRVDTVGNLEGMLVTDETIEGTIECLSASGHGYGGSVSSCDDLIATTTTFEVEITSPSTARVRLPDHEEEEPAYAAVELTRRSESKTVSVQINPQQAQLSQGESVEFLAAASGASNTDVTWSASGGSLSGSGNEVAYTAGSSPGSYEVTATSVVDGSVFASASITVAQVAVEISPSEASLAGGQSQEFSATVTGSSDTSVAWSATGGTISGSGATINYTAPTQGGEYEVTATSNADPSKSATATVTVSQVGVSISPASAELLTGQSQEFTASVTGAADASVTWSASGGSVSGSGNTVTYVAPDEPGSHVVTATSNADPSKSATANITVNEVTVTITPESAELIAGASQEFTASVGGAADTSVTWSATGGTISGGGNTVTYTAPSQAGEYEVTATSNADPTKSATATVTVTEVSVSISPESAELLTGESASFTAEVSGTTDTSVTWSATGGAISGGGNTVTYTAPSQAGEYEVTATSNADPTKSATATVTVTEVSVSISPESVELLTGESASFTAQVSGATDTSVTWSTTGGTISGSGNTITYTAPQSGGTYSVTATSQADPSKSATANVTVREPDPAVIISFSAAPESIDASEQATLEWTVEGTAPITLTIDQGVGNVSDTTSVVVSPSETKAYTLTASNAAGSDTATVTVEVVQPQPRWIRQFGSTSIDIGAGVAVNASGLVYVTGHTRGDLAGPVSGFSDVFLAQFDASGSERWLRQFGESSESSDSAAAVAVDPAGSALIGGTTYLEDDFDPGLLVLKYDSLGNQEWMQQFYFGEGENATGIAVDASGNAFVSGDSWIDEDAILVKYDQDGNHQWVQMVGDWDYWGIYSQDVAVDASGDIYLTGYTSDSLAAPNAGGYDVFLAKYDTGGNQLWVRQFGSSFDDYGRSVAVGGDGSVYIAGSTEGNLGGASSGGSDVFLAKYDASGNQLWVEQFGGSAGDYGRGVAVDDQGYVYVTGSTRGALEGSSAGGHDVFLAQFEANGNRLQVWQFGTSADDYGRAVAADGDGNVFVAGDTGGTLASGGGGGRDVFLAKFSP